MKDLVTNQPWALLTLLLVGVACAKPVDPNRPAPAVSDTTEVESEDGTPKPPPPDRTLVVGNNSGPAVEPRVALMAGLMPLSSTGVDRFRQQHPTYDGRGVIIGILDSGIDAGLEGFQINTAGGHKVVDLRDFSGEGRVALQPVTPSAAGTITIGGQELAGFGTVAGIASPPYYGGVFREITLGEADANANKRLTDEFPILVVKTTSGWAVIPDGDGDGRLDDEQPVHDYLVARETFTLADGNDKHGEGPMTIAVNIQDDGDRPTVDLFFDNASHGSHVAGIASGHKMFGVEGFDGVAPGAQILAAKIANNARGGITVTGSMVRALNYVADFAQQRGVPLVINMSFGVGNDIEGSAAIDSIINEFALKHPDVLLVISAGNDGPGISTVGFPGSAEHVLSACALFPGVFTGPRPQGFATDADGIADFSSRGGELGKPDLCVPGVAFSNVPRWNLGDEISGGTSMAAPQVSGAAALLQSAQVQLGRPARANELRQALLASSRAARSDNVLDMGAGVPQLPIAFEWLQAGHQAGTYEVRSLPDGGNSSKADAAYRRSGLQSPADTVQRFTVRSVAGLPAAKFFLKSDAPWLRAPRTLELSGGPATVELTYNPSEMLTPGLYVGSVWATPASDTLAGFAFRLTNTVVVSHPLTQPFVEGRDLGPGRVRRYYFDIDENSGGFTVELELRYQTQRGLLYIFEPDGQPFRGGSQEEAGGESARIRTTVRAEDVIPGVYEVVVSAPATSALSYELRVGLPRYAIDEIATGPTAVVRMSQSSPPFVQDASVFQRQGDVAVVDDSVQVTAEVVGAVGVTDVTGNASTAETLPLKIPEWAKEVVLDVRLPDGVWHQLTDFGVTVFDTSGAKVSESPLSYGSGRHKMEIHPGDRGGTLTLELFPAWAHLEPPSTWTAEVTVTYIARRAKKLAKTNVDTMTTFTLAPGESRAVQFEPLSVAELTLPTGFQYVVEVTASPAGGAPAVRRRALR